MLRELLDAVDDRAAGQRSAMPVGDVQAVLAVQVGFNFAGVLCKQGQDYLSFGSSSSSSPLSARSFQMEWISRAVKPWSTSLW